MFIMPWRNDEWNELCNKNLMLQSQGQNFRTYNLSIIPWIAWNLFVNICNIHCLENCKKKLPQIYTHQSKTFSHNYGDCVFRYLSSLQSMMNILARVFAMRLQSDFPPEYTISFMCHSSWYIDPISHKVIGMCCESYGFSSWTFLHIRPH